MDSHSSNTSKAAAEGGSGSGAGGVTSIVNGHDLAAVVQQQLQQEHELELEETLPQNSSLDTPVDVQPQAVTGVDVADVHDVADVDDVDEGWDESADQGAITTDEEMSDINSWTDSDSAIGSMGSYATSTYTIGSGVDDLVEENGRTYHVYKDGKYLLPNDEFELNRLDIQHKMWEITLRGKLHLAPLGPNPQNVLDIATGTGIWAIDFADTYPSAKVTGTDLSMIQPQYVPPNCQFEIDDAEDEWLFTSSFDYIHGRALMSCFRDPRAIIQKAYNALAPGGYLELQDLKMQIYEEGSPRGAVLDEWDGYLVQATQSMGLSWDNVQNYARWMREVGFEDVEEKKFRWPSNQWSTNRREKLLGAWAQIQVEAGFVESISTRLFRGKLGWSEERLRPFLEGVKRDFADTSIRSYAPVTIAYGRKPLDA